MKKLLFLGLVLASGAIVRAQCKQKIILTSSKTEYLDSSKKVQRVVDEKTIVEISPTDVVIMPGNEKMSGPITSKTCAWTKPFKEGKSVIKADLKSINDEKKVTITIEGKNGKVTLLAEVDDRPDKKIFLISETFAEKK